ncbi:flippase [Candidatus Gottesmanbacteria bacterium]|nr:flippase [Candidatus Gottesmanbacteria bacterium]
MSTRAVVFWNTTSQLIGKLIGASTAFVVAFLLARRLGADGYGDFTKITTFVAPFFLVADFGLNAIFLQKKDSDLWWPHLLGLRLAAGFSLMFLALAILALTPQGTTQGYTGFVRFGIILFTPAVLFQAIITTANAVFQKQLRYDLATIAIAAGSAATLILVLPQTAGVLSSLVAVVIGTAVTAIVSFVLARRNSKTTGVALTPGTLRHLFVPAIPLGATLLFNLVYFRADSFIITFTRSTGEVGIYGLAYKVFELPLVLPTFFMNAVYPLMIQDTGDRRQTGLKKIFRSASIYLFLVSCILLLVTWLAAPLLSLIKSDFTSSVGALRVLSLGLPFFFLTSLTMWTLIALKKQWVLAAIYGASMLLNILLNIWFIPLYGYMAAAWVTVGSEAVVLIVSGWVLIRQMRQIGHIRQI